MLVALSESWHCSVLGRIAAANCVEQFGKGRRMTGYTAILQQKSIANKHRGSQCMHSDSASSRYSSSETDNTVTGARRDAEVPLAAWKYLRRADSDAGTAQRWVIVTQWQISWMSRLA